MQSLAGRVMGRGSGVDKDMNFTVETASYRIAVLSKILNRPTCSRPTLYVSLSRFVESMEVALLYSNYVHPQTWHCSSYRAFCLSYLSRDLQQYVPFRLVILKFSLSRSIFRQVMMVVSAINRVFTLQATNQC